MTLRSGAVFLALKFGNCCVEVRHIFGSSTVSLALRYGGLCSSTVGKGAIFCVEV